MLHFLCFCRKCWVDTELLFTIIKIDISADWKVENIMRIMAIDYGKRRIGIALSDPLGVIAQPYRVLQPRSEKELIKRLKYIITQNNVGFVLIGNPLSMKGTFTKKSVEVKEFMQRLIKAAGVKAELWDERFTSKYARNAFKDLGLRVRRGDIDKVAACIMLAEYLKSHPACAV